MLHRPIYFILKLCHFHSSDSQVFCIQCSFFYVCLQSSDGVVTEKIIYTWILRFVFRKHLYRLIWDWHIKQGHHLVVKSTHWLNHFFVFLSFCLFVFLYFCIYVSLCQSFWVHLRTSEVVLALLESFCAFLGVEELYLGIWWMDGWMLVIIGHRSSTSTFGANKNEFEGRRVAIGGRIEIWKGANLHDDPCAHLSNWKRK